jgi:hypothetical protein
MYQIKNKLDFLEQENQRTKINLSTFKAKSDQRQKIVKNLNSVVEKIQELQTEKTKIIGQNNIEKKSRPLQTIEKKSKPVVWL